MLREDDKKFYVKSASGKELPVAKTALSEERRKQYSNELARRERLSQVESPEETGQVLEGDERFNISEKPEQIMFSSELNLAPQQSRVPEPLNMTPVPQQGIMGQPIHQQMPPMGQPELGLAPQAPGAQIPVGSTVTTQTRPGIEMPPEVKQGLQKGYEKQIEAQVETQKALDKYAVENQKFYDDLQVELTQSQARLDSIQQMRAQAAEEGRAKVESLQEKYAKAEIDPNRFFGNSTGKRIMAGIAIAFGSFGKAFTGGQTNTALKIINDAIERDIASQKSEIAKLGRASEFQRQMNADIDSAFASQGQSELAKRVVMLDNAKLQAERIAKNLKTEQQKADAIGFIGQLEQQKADAMAKLSQLTADEKTISEVKKFVSPESLPSGRQDPKYFESASKLRQEYNKNPVTASTIARRESIETIRAAKESAESGEMGAGDLAFIFAYMKMLDPGSVVREGEFEVARKTSGIPDQVWNTYQRVNDGAKLTQTQRDNFMSTAERIFERQQKLQEKVDKRYTGLATRAGIEPIDVIIFDEKSLEEQNPENLSATFEPAGRNPARNTAGR